MRRLTPVKAIRHFCISCSGHSTLEVRLCPAQNCELYPYRLGKNPAYKKSDTLPLTLKDFQKTIENS